MATKTANNVKRVVVGAKPESARVRILHAFRAGAELATRGNKAKKTALAEMLAQPGVKHGTTITDPVDNTVWTVTNEPTMTDPKATAWDALMASDILDAAGKRKAKALHKSLSKPSVSQGIKKA